MWWCAGVFCIRIAHLCFMCPMILGLDTDRQGSTVSSLPPEGSTVSVSSPPPEGSTVSSPLPQDAPLLPAVVVIVMLMVLNTVLTVMCVLTVIYIKKRLTRRPQHGKRATGAVEMEDFLEPVTVAVPAAASETVPGSPYETLEMSDMGLGSDYSQLGAEEPQAAQGRGDYYSSLQMSNVGVRSDYSELGDQHDTA